MSLYHIAKPDGTRIGPYDVNTINAMLASGQLSPACLVWTNGWAEWRPISTIAAVAPAVPGFPPPFAPVSGASWGPIVAFKTVVFRRYATFTGRASRSEYWWFALADFLISIVLLAVAGILALLLGGVTGDPGVGLAVFGLFYILFLLASLAILVPGIAVAVRRLHDGGFSGWFLLLSLIPYVGGIVMLVFMLLPSAPPNQWGAASDKPLA